MKVFFPQPHRLVIIPLSLHEELASHVSQKSPHSRPQGRPTSEMLNQESPSSLLVHRLECDIAIERPHFGLAEIEPIDWRVGQPLGWVEFSGAASPHRSCEGGGFSFS
jgi:hypothetical protein